MAHADPVFVEIAITAPMAALWERTQHPAEHSRWDLRFHSITYLPRPAPEGPQRFRYETRLGFGLRIAGWGETEGGAEGAASALRFGSEDALSLIREGTGCWVYHQDEGRVRFRTIYHYDVRFGRIGQWIDRLLFRPLMGWATAWSFDRLRLWVEQGVAPEASRQMALVHGLARLLLGFAWVWHGLVPKLLFPDRGELAMSVRIFPEHAAIWLPIVGLCEMGLGAAVWGWGRSRWVLGLAALALAGLTGLMAVTQPETLTAPMNPLTLNLALIGLAAAAQWTAPYAPNARRCRRRKDGSA